MHEYDRYYIYEGYESESDGHPMRVKTLQLKRGDIEAIDVLGPNNPIVMFRMKDKSSHHYPLSDVFVDSDLLEKPQCKADNPNGVLYPINSKKPVYDRL